MEIKSLSFLLFCFFIVFFYFLLEKTNKQKYILFIADIILITKISGKKGGVILFLFGYLVFMMGKLLEKTEKRYIRRLYEGIGFIGSIGLLIYFKYFTFTYDTFQKFFEMRQIYLPSLIAPIGLSYYTLSMFGYLHDICHKKYAAEKNYINFMSFIMFFPAIFEGPINLYQKLMPQLLSVHKFDWDRMVFGLQRVLWGYIKKVVVADRIGILVTGILQDDNTHGYLTILAMVFYSFQIYADFSGGIDVIMGITEILGIQLTENFKSPLVSKNVTEYWQRWHKSLGEWMEKYIYYPLVFNRRILKFSKKISNKYMSRAFSAIIASVIVFVIVGIWHGTGWNYVVYGMYQAFFVSTAVALAPVYKRCKSLLHINESCISWKMFSILRTFVILILGRVLIKAGNLSQAGLIYKKMLELDNIAALFTGSLFEYGLDYKNYYLMLLGIFGLIVVDVLHERGIKFRQLLMKQDIVFRYFIYMSAIFLIIIMGIYGPDYEASAFIYQAY